jgi:CheY-like chemotaxis protein
MIDEVLQMVGPIAQRKHIPLIGAASPDLDSWVNTDTSRLKQILLNLVSNAVKFTESGAVTVIARPAQGVNGRWVQISVSDTGPGMSESEQAAAFDTFVQGNSSTHTKHGGSGLGLAIAQRLTVALGGSLQLSSTVGEGTVFRILLPVGDLRDSHAKVLPAIPGQAVVSGHPVAVQAVALALERAGKRIVPHCSGEPGTLHVRVVSDTGSVDATRPEHDGHRLLVMGPTVTVAASPTAGEYLPLPWSERRLTEVLGGQIPVSIARETLSLPAGLRVLLAEDDTTNRNLIAEMLRRLGAAVHTVSDGAAAVEEVARDRYDVVLLDLNMPVMDGIEAVRIIRQRLADAQSLAVLAVSADPGWTDRSVLAAAGFSGYVLKPTTMADLHIGISKVLERVPTTAALPVQRQPAPDISLDRETLSILVEDLGDEDLVAAAVTVFLEELPGRMVALHRAFGEQDALEIRAVAHTLKGSAAMLGATRLSTLCAAVETDPSDAQLGELTAEAEQVETLMRDYLLEESVAG